MSNDLVSKEQLNEVEEADTYRWLEEVEGENALNWVMERNKKCQGYYWGELFECVTSVHYRSSP